MFVPENRRLNFCVCDKLTELCSGCVKRVVYFSNTLKKDVFFFPEIYDVQKETKTQRGRHGGAGQGRKRRRGNREEEERSEEKAEETDCLLQTVVVSSGEGQTGDVDADDLRHRHEFDQPGFGPSGSEGEDFDFVFLEEPSE